MNRFVHYVNENIDLRGEYFRIFGRELPYGKFLCPNPLHKHTSNTPSCKVYGNRFKCFGQCGRTFGVYDLLSWYDKKRLEEIKSTHLINSESSNYSLKHVPLHKVQVDRSLPLLDVLNKILNE